MKKNSYWLSGVCRNVFMHVCIVTVVLAQSGANDLSGLESVARSRGYSEEQIAAMKLQQSSSSADRTVQQNQSPYFSEHTRPVQSGDSLAFFTDSVSINDTVISDTLGAVDTMVNDFDTLQEDVLPYFGYSLFEKIPEAFKPNEARAADPGYLVGPGDVLRLSVWGEVEFQYELKIDKNGKVFIPVAGQFYVAGVPFETLQKKLQNLLSKHYSGLASRPQRSFMDLSVARLYPIRIFMMGEVKVPGGYTVSASSTAFNAFYSVGGPLTSGSLRDISVLRNQEVVAKIDMYDYLTTGKCSTDVRLLADDVVFTPRRGKTVAVKGAVFKPAIYELKKGESLLSLLTYCGGVLPQSNSGRLMIKRVKPIADRVAHESVQRLLDVDLERLFRDSMDVALCDNDTIVVSPLSFDLKNYVTLSGAVHYPGKYQVENLSLYSLVYELGQPVETRAFTARADLVRLNPDRVTFSTIPVNLQQLRNDSAAFDMQLEPYDEVIVFEKEVEKPIDLLITIDGEVRNPGLYTMSTNQTVVDVLLRAGGFSRKAYKSSVDVYRLRISENESDTITETFKVPLPDSINYIASRDGQFRLVDRDRIVVRPDPGYITDNYVTIKGQVKFRGKYALHVRGERLSELIGRAGGLLPDAFLEGATVVREKQRVVVNFAEALSNMSSSEDVLLQKGDSITIPPRPNTVLVSGNVNNPGLFSYVKNGKLRTYIDRAGGYVDSSTYILLTSPGGETSKVGRIGFRNPVVKDGSEIVIMRKRPRDRSGERKGPTISEVIRDTLAIVASAVTVISLVIRLDD